MRRQRAEDDQLQQLGSYEAAPGDVGRVLLLYSGGLMLAFACPEAPDVARRLLLEQRLVVNATGPDTLRLLPPVTVSDAEIDEAVRRILAAMSDHG